MRIFEALFGMFLLTEICVWKEYLGLTDLKLMNISFGGYRLVGKKKYFHVL